MDDDLEGDQGKDGCNITEDCEELNLTIQQSRKRQTEMEKYCPQQGLPERGDIVFVAEALSQVS